MKLEINTKTRANKTDSIRDNLNKLITDKEINNNFLKISHEESSRLYEFTGKFYQIFKEEILPILTSLRKTVETLSNSFYEDYVS